MKILTLGLDQSILQPSSALAQRVKEYGRLADKYVVIVPAVGNQEIKLSDSVTVYGVAGANKVQSLINIFRLAKKILINDKYDIISVQDIYFLAYISLILAKKFNIALQIQVHGFEKFYGLRKIISKYVLPKADGLRAVSKRLKNQLINEFKINEKKISVIPIYVPVDRFNQSNQLSQKETEKFIFLYVGRLAAVKNIEMQILTVADLIKDFPQIELWLVGDGPQRNVLERLVKKLELTAKVKFFGWQNAASKYYQQSDIFLLTSNFEGWGMAIIEAASFGLPIIMTDVGCAEEVIKNQESGLVIPINDQEKLKEAMIKLINNQFLREELGKRALTAIKSLPSQEETLALIKKSWENCLANKNKL